MRGLILVMISFVAVSCSKKQEASSSVTGAKTTQVSFSGNSSSGTAVTCDEFDCSSAVQIDSN